MDVTLFWSQKCAMIGRCRDLKKSPSSIEYDTRPYQCAWGFPDFFSYFCKPNSCDLVFSWRHNDVSTYLRRSEKCVKTVQGHWSILFFSFEFLTLEDVVLIFSLFSFLSTPVFIRLYALFFSTHVFSSQSIIRGRHYCLWIMHSIII